MDKRYLYFQQVILRLVP